MAQFTVAIALISTLSIAAINAGLSLLKIQPVMNIGAHSLCFAISLFLFVLAILLALLATVSRALDFRLTAHKVRGQKDITMFGLDDKQYGRISWCLFWSALLALLLGGFLFVLSVCTAFFTQFCTAQ
ncbi:MAG TPA: hypothetical protein DCM36_05225 [Xanthomonadaceae bacterium]|nr:hypothetical protein [Xanthomonadaceae bacterium]